MRDAARTTGLGRRRVVDPDVLDLPMVRVGGFSAHFVEPGRNVQDEVLARTCHGGVGMGP